jgi:hypothetical protein
MMRSCGIHEKVLDDLCWKGLKAKVKDKVLFFTSHKVIRGCYMTGLIG